METMRDRATDLFPSVLLTVLSMIQALALELLWTRLGESSYLWALDWDAVVGWAQAAAMFLGFLLVWLFYVSFVMRFRWLPSIQDSVVPFGIGILEFTLVDLMGPDWLGPWFYAFAVIFAVSTWANHTIFRRARQDPANREYFEAVRPATLRDFMPSMVAVVGLGFFGVVLHASGSRGWLALVAILMTIAALGYQIDLTHRYWERSLAISRPSSAAAGGQLPPSRAS
jgi:hypothetical protein